MRPPFLFLGCLAAGHGLDHLLPLPFDWFASHVPRHAISGGLLAAGAALFVAGIRGFSRDGIYGWSRNPIYIGLFLLYAGLGVHLRGPWILLLMLPLSMVMHFGVVARDEAFLEREFGEAYRSYKARVPRWL